MTEPHEPITVAALIEHLQSMDPNAVVMVDCVDGYYSGPLTSGQLSTGTAFKRGPSEWKTTGEDAYGKPEPVRTVRSQGGWATEEDSRAEELDRKPCVIIQID